jgi:hypothetical protein
LGDFLPRKRGKALEWFPAATIPAALDGGTSQASRSEAFRSVSPGVHGEPIDDPIELLASVLRK